MRNKSLLTLVGVAILIVAAIATTSADVSHDPNSPITIDQDQYFDFSLVGNRAGEFAYYSLEYKGDASVVTIELDMAPGDPAAQRGVGFHVYCCNGYLIGTGRRSEDKVDRKVLEWADRNSTRWLIQVYNYLHGVPVGFRLTVSGLPVAPPPREEMQPSQAALFSVAADGLIGDRAGNFKYYKVESKGDGAEVALKLDYAPKDRWISNAFGVNVYAPVDGLLVAQAGDEASFKLDMAGTYLVQVYNYLHGVDIRYSLRLSEP